MHQRKTTRLSGFDYSSNRAYFVTICCHSRRELFGHIVDFDMCLNEHGEIAQRCWEETPQHFVHSEIDAFVVMPNHVHGIICLLDVPATFLPQDESANLPRSLGTVVAAYKAAVTRAMRLAGHNAQQPVWQRGYFDRIIRNDYEWERVRNYIANNPAQWELDEENPKSGIPEQKPWE